ncbi:hypothetical protein N9R79_06630 [Vibrio sp.]|nr:hypothetical protein [Vibrio sp.]
MVLPSNKQTSIDLYHYDDVKLIHFDKALSPPAQSFYDVCLDYFRNDGIEKQWKKWHKLQ